MKELTPREQEILALMAEGRSNADIAGRTHLSLASVERAISAIFTKLALPPGNRRVLAVLNYLSTTQPTRPPKTPPPTRLPT
ncbi:response regulator transcription factor [Nonomuraea sp. NPDC050556]|uniref:response regulator transcription factor n=1 Tax=Nonomuraea sp. NPDC050556 TaxID=3364369 RepID=UPI0037BB5F1F